MYDIVQVTQIFSLYITCVDLYWIFMFFLCGHCLHLKMCLNLTVLVFICFVRTNHYFDFSLFLQSLATRITLFMKQLVEKAGFLGIMACASVSETLKPVVISLCFIVAKTYFWTDKFNLPAEMLMMHMVSCRCSFYHKLWWRILLWQTHVHYFYCQIHFCPSFISS